MKKLLKLISLTTILVVSTGSYASEKFNFSYKFSDNKILSGSFFGDRDKNLINNISNENINFEGKKLVFDNYESADGHGNPFISFDGKSNNLDFYNDINNQELYSYGNFIYYSNEKNYSIQELINISRLSITSAVPEPGIYAMLLMGLGLIKLTARRKQKEQLTSTIL